MDQGDPVEPEVTDSGSRPAAEAATGHPVLRLRRASPVLRDPASITSEPRYLVVRDLAELDVAAGGDADGRPGPSDRTPWRPSKRGVAAALVAGLIGMFFFAGSAASRPADFTSNAVVEIRRPDVFLDVNPGTISVLNALRSKYVALIDTDPIVGPTAEALDLDPEAVRRAVGAGITSDSLLFYPFAVADDAEEAQAIAQTATEELVDYATEEQRAVGVPGDEQIELRIVQDATEGTKAARNNRRAIVSGLVGGAVLAVAAFAVVEFVVRRRRS